MVISTKPISYLLSLDLAILNMGNFFNKMDQLIKIINHMISLSYKNLNIA
jgi:hypothetical protein